MQYEQVYSLLMPKLETGLPGYITYHDAQHTKNVIAAAEYLGLAGNITEKELLLLKTAALFHDAGFLQHHQDHEELSCKMARRILPDYQYNPEHIEEICTMIMATKLPQSASDHLSRLLCDADLYYLGSDEYAVNAEKLFREFRKSGTIKTREEWDLKQVAFLTEHRYFTKTAIAEREEMKQQNLQQLKQKIGASAIQGKPDHVAEMIQDACWILAGVISAGFALKGFLVPNHFFDGGITGISLLIHEVYHFNLAVVLILFNLPFIIISYFSVGRRFAYRTFISVLLLGVSLFLLPDFALTSDKLLISIFGGVFLGIGIGLIMRTGAALDGIEVLALYTLKRTSFTITEIILGINILIFTIAAFLFGIETALYSVLTYFAATRSIDYVVEGLQAYTGVTIISGKSEVIKYQLVNNLGRGITVYKGERGFLPGNFEVSADCDIIFTVITRLELRKLKNLVSEVDPNAFVFANTIKEASGGIIKRRRRH
ncbi:MAG: YitT family protein [Chitinophagaceae bacterium]|nr:YitT family protein [Chitinophagaceae bacterium]